MVELIDIIDEDEVYQYLLEAYMEYIDSNYNDVPTQPMSFKEFVEKVVYYVVVWDLHRYSLLVATADEETLRDLILESFEGTNYIRPTREDNYQYRITLIESICSIYIERELVNLN